MDRIIEQKRGLQRKHLPYIALTGIILVILGWILFGNHSSTMRVAADGLTISQVQQAEFKDYVRLSGQVVPIQVVQLSPEGQQVGEAHAFSTDAEEFLQWLKY